MVVKLFYSGFYTHEVVAKNEEEAILIARQLELKKNELFANIQNWKEADSA